MILAFRLHMPDPPSWDGKWSGDRQLLARTRTVQDDDQARELVGDHYYRWDDGWIALVDVQVVDAAEAAEIKRRSAGFFGYDWMIDSLLECGEIRWRGRG